MLGNGTVNMLAQQEIKSTRREELMDAVHLIQFSPVQ
jgi:hypothetical protein